MEQRKKFALMSQRFIRVMAEVENVSQDQVELDVPPELRLDLRPLWKMLQNVTYALHHNRPAEARQHLSNYSGLSPALGLARQRWANRENPAPSTKTAESAKLRAKTSQTNGRHRRSPVCVWTPFPGDDSLLRPGVSWHRAQAQLMLLFIVGEMYLGKDVGKYLDTIANHELSVRTERELALMLENEKFQIVRKQLPFHWRPRSYYHKTPNAVEARLRHIKRKVQAAIPIGVEFFIRVDKGRNPTPTIVGPYQKLRMIRLAADQLHESEIYFRRADAAEWTPVTMPLFRPRKRRSEADKMDYINLCREHGKHSAAAIIFAWERWGARPSKKGVEAVRREHGDGPGWRLAEELAVASKRRPIRMIKEQFDSTHELSMLDEQPSSDPRHNVSF